MPYSIATTTLILESPHGTFTSNEALSYKLQQKIIYSPAIPNLTID